MMPYECTLPQAGRRVAMLARVLTLHWTLLVIVLSALAAALMSRPGVWGLAGATVYAGGQLLTFLSGEAAEDARAVRMAWWRFGMAVFFGFVAAEGFGPTIATFAHDRVQPQAVWLVVGLAVNGAWPAFEKALGQRAGRILDAIFGGRK